MYQMHVVCVGHRLANPNEHAKPLMKRRVDVFQPDIEVFPFGQLHRQPRLSIPGDTSIDQARNARMIQFGQKMPLTFERITETRIVAAQQLDGHTLFECAIRTFSQIYRTHAAAPNLLQQPPGTGTQAVTVGGLFARQFFGKPSKARHQGFILGKCRAQIEYQVGIDAFAQGKKALAFLAGKLQRAVDQRFQPPETFVDRFIHRRNPQGKTDSATTPGTPPYLPVHTCQNTLARTGAARTIEPSNAIEQARMKPSTSNWMPDLCRTPALFGIAVAVEVVVLAAMLTRLPQTAADWTALFTASLFAQWMALLCAAALCRLRPLIHALPQLPGVALALVVPTVICTFAALFVALIDQSFNAGWTVPPEKTVRFAVVCGAIGLLLAAGLLRYFYINEQWAAQIAAHSGAQVQALQARIRPHFLFNSMNSIASLIRHDPATAERAVEDLSELFRAALGSDAGESTLGEELHFCERYLAIEALRLGPRLQQRWELAPKLPRQLALPRLILQPLVENAIVHGISPLAEGGAIIVRARCEGDALHIEIANPCPEKPARIHGNHHAQDNIRQRLAHRFGTRASMTAQATPGYYAVVLTLPLSTPT